jgi:uncharacterized membrane protein YfcA
MSFSLLYAALAVFAGGILRGFTGFGFAVAAVPLLSLVINPAEAVAIVLILQVAIGLSDFRKAWPMVEWSVLSPIALGMAAATPLGLFALQAVSPELARLAIAVTLAIATSLLLTGWRLPGKPTVGTAAAVGLVSGLFNGLAAMPGPPVVAYCLGLRLPPVRARATLIVYFMATSILGLAGAWLTGLVGRQEWLSAAIAFPLLYGGSGLGAALFRKAGPTLYQTLALTTLSMLTVIVTLRALADILL